MTCTICEISHIQYIGILLEITKLDKEKNQYTVLGKKMGAQNIVKEIKQYQKKVATTHTEDGHK